MSTTTPVLEPAERLLVDLSRVRPRPEPAHHPFGEIDLDRLLRLGARHGNFNLIARRLMELHPTLDPELRARTERNLGYIELRERLALADVAELGRELHARGEVLVLLKGGAYTRFIYPQRGLRTFLDIDVLVRPQAVELATAILARLGYGRLHEIEGAIDFSRAVGSSSISLKIELHTSLMHHYNFPWYRAELALSEEKLMARSEPRSLEGSPIQVLSASDELLYSVLHFFFHHDLEGLKYHSDINALLTDPNRVLDPDLAIAAAREARAEHAVGLALCVQECLFGPGAVPAALLDALAPRGLRRFLLGLVLPPLERIPLSETRVAGHPAKVLSAPGVIAPMSLAMRWLFPGRKFLEGFYGIAQGGWSSTLHLRYPAEIAKKALRRGIATAAGA